MVSGFSRDSAIGALVGKCKSSQQVQDGEKIIALQQVRRQFAPAK